MSVLYRYFVWTTKTRRDLEGLALLQEQVAAYVQRTSQLFSKRNSLLTFFVMPVYSYPLSLGHTCSPTVSIVSACIAKTAKTIDLQNFVPH